MNIINCLLLRIHKPLNGWLRYFGILIVMLFFFISICHANDTENQALKEAEQRDEQSLEEKWGIKIVGIRLTASDYMLDFRYRVLNPERASDLIQKQTKPYLIHQETGKKMPVPKTRLGPLRQTGVKPIPDRNYAILFANSNKLVKPGDRVTVVIGNFKAENLVVE